jgi:hypothetical protein
MEWAELNQCTRFGNWNALMSRKDGVELVCFLIAGLTHFRAAIYTPNGCLFSSANITQSVRLCDFGKIRAARKRDQVAGLYLGSIEDNIFTCAGDTQGMIAGLDVRVGWRCFEESRPIGFDKPGGLEIENRAEGYRQDKDIDGVRRAVDLERAEREAETTIGINPQPACNNVCGGLRHLMKGNKGSDYVRWDNCFAVLEKCCVHIRRREVQKLAHPELWCIQLDLQKALDLPEFFGLRRDGRNRHEVFFSKRTISLHLCFALGKKEIRNFGPAKKEVRKELLLIFGMNLQYC